GYCFSFILCAQNPALATSASIGPVGGCKERLILRTTPQDVQIVAVIKCARAPSLARSPPEGLAPRSRDSGPIHETRYRRRRREESLISCLSRNNKTP